MIPYKNKKYLTDPKGLKKKIEKYGVAIIPNILNEKEIVSMNSGMWDYLEHITQSFEIPMDRDNSKTWVEYLKLYPFHSMLLQRYGVGHSQFVWDIRQNEKVVDIFSELWGTPKEELLTSFDAVSLHFPPEETKRGWFHNLWYHTDQSYVRNGFECVQSWVTGYDVDEGDATLAFMEKSNHYHKEFGETFSIQNKNDWYKLSKEEQKFYEDKGCREIKIKCSAGSMVFWDSRTIHCGCEPIKERNHKQLRNVVYVCMTPKKLATSTMIKKKQKAFNELRMTTHWPHKPKLFPVHPRTYGGVLPNVTSINPPKLSSLGKKIAGF
mgnify:CR=1 FL=1|tara:strand:- start:138 stop:1106 length:969 start_codon:yes stop_codon:yes gene_type:complete